MYAPNHMFIVNKKISLEYKEYVHYSDEKYGNQVQIREFMLKFLHEGNSITLFNLERSVSVKRLTLKTEGIKRNLSNIQLLF